MTWRIGRARVSTGSVWRIGRVRAAIVQNLGTWRVARARVSINPTGTWRIGRARVAVSVATAPVITVPSTATVDPIWPATITATVTNGVVPDSFSFSSPGITFTVSGNTATYSPPGLRDGNSFTITVTATVSGQTSSAVTQAVTVRKGTIFRVVNGQYVVTSNLYSG